MNITKPEDYVGRFAISQNKYTTPKLEGFITDYEKFYLIDLLGPELYELFIADLAAPVIGEPTDQRFKNIYDPIYLEKNNCFNYRRISRGIPEMLKQFIFFEFTRKQNPKNTITGNVTNINENSKPAKNSASYMNPNYNEGVLSYRTIQEFILANKVDYPEFDGTEKRLITLFY